MNLKRRVAIGAAAGLLLSGVAVGTVAAATSGHYTTPTTYSMVFGPRATSSVPLAASARCDRSCREGGRLTASATTFPSTPCAALLPKPYELTETPISATSGVITYLTVTTTNAAPATGGTRSSSPSGSVRTVPTTATSRRAASRSLGVHRPLGRRPAAGSARSPTGSGGRTCSRTTPGSMTRGSSTSLAPFQFARQSGARRHLPDYLRHRPGTLRRAERLRPGRRSALCAAGAAGDRHGKRHHRTGIVVRKRTGAGGHLASQPPRTRRLCGLRGVAAGTDGGIDGLAGSDHLDSVSRPLVPGAGFLPS